MFNHLRNTEKTKKCTLYTNYQLSTKNFDGNTLYQLFLARGHINPTSTQYNRAETRADIRLESRRSLNQGHRSQMRKRSEGRQILSKKDKSETQQDQRKKQLNTLCFSSFVDQRQRINQQLRNNNFYQSLCKFLNRQDDQKTKEIEKKNFFETVQKPNYSSIQNKTSERAKKLSRRSKPKIEVKDFVKLQDLQSDLWIEGKLGDDFSAESISIICNTKRVYSYEGDIIRQIASLTKIMTCITALYLCKKFQINMLVQEVKVSRKASLLQGTTAGLENGDMVTIYDLLHGMMLPSGNDAAQALSDYFDKIIEQKKRKIQKELQSDNQKQIKWWTLKADRTGKSSFISEMNKLAQHLKMKNTKFENPHGLANRNNYSTANDVCQLCHYAMKNSDFRDIVKCKEYEGKIYSSRFKMRRVIKWQNTNKLLSLDYCEGIKTGITPTAGPCMAASFSNESFSMLIVILNAKSKSKRFQEVKNLYQWAQKQFNIQN